MARRYVNPARPSTSVTDAALEQARERAAAAADRLRDAEQADPTSPGWDGEYDAASTALRAAERRVEALERLRASQIERGGKREATVKAAARDLTAAAKELTASRDRVADAARQHLQALSALAAAVDGHNQLLTAQRAMVAGLGLAVHDDLVGEGQEHAEGTLEGGGLRAGDVDWIPIPAGGLEAHALRLVFSGYSAVHPLAQAGKYQWRPHEVEARADQLRVPSLKDAGASAAPAPPPVVMPDRPSIRDLAAPPVLPMSHPDWKPPAEARTRRRQ